MTFHYCKVVRDIKREDDNTIIALTGDVDMKHSMSLRDIIITELDPKPAALLIDLSQVSFMDSSGLAVIIEALQRTNKAKTKLKLFGMKQQVRNIFEIARLEKVFQIYETEQEALQ